MAKNCEMRFLSLFATSRNATRSVERYKIRSTSFDWFSSYKRRKTKNIRPKTPKSAKQQCKSHMDVTALCRCRTASLLREKSMFRRQIPSDNRFRRETNAHCKNCTFFNAHTAWPPRSRLARMIIMQSIVKPRAIKPAVYYAIYCCDRSMPACASILLPHARHNYVGLYVIIIIIMLLY